MATHDEAYYKGKLLKHLRERLPPDFVSFRHEGQAITAGWPDITVTGNCLTTLFEAKLADPEIRTRGIQELTMKRLFIASGGRAFYLVWWQPFPKKDPEFKRTYILRPDEFARTDWNTHCPPERHCPDFNHKFVENFIRRTHGCP